MSGGRSCCFHRIGVIVELDNFLRDIDLRRTVNDRRVLRRRVNHDSIAILLRILRHQGHHSLRNVVHRIRCSILVILLGILFLPLAATLQLLNFTRQARLRFVTERIGSRLKALLIILDLLSEALQLVLPWCKLRLDLLGRFLTFPRYPLPPLVG